MMMLANLEIQTPEITLAIPTWVFTLLYALAYLGMTALVGGLMYRYSALVAKKDYRAVIAGALWPVTALAAAGYWSVTGSYRGLVAAIHKVGGAGSPQPTEKV